MIFIIAVVILGFSWFSVQLFALSYAIFFSIIIKKKVIRTNSANYSKNVKLYRKSQMTRQASFMIFRIITLHIIRLYFLNLHNITSRITY